MRTIQIQKYEKLNELAEQGGIVIFGTDNDISIPLGEIRQAFAVEQKMYNRSLADLSIADAVQVYEKNVASLSPETVLIHLGSKDKELFEKDPTAFDNSYRDLINCIKAKNGKCRIAVVSLRNYDDVPWISDMNHHLKNIADSELCEYGDIAIKKVWNPKNTMDTVSFVYSVGFVRPLNNKRPLYDLVRMIFGYEI